jgi:hypothetical protein
MELHPSTPRGFSLRPEGCKDAMNLTYFPLLAIFVLVPRVSAQEREPVIRVEALSAFVWGEDSASGAISSSVQDPLTGKVMHKLSYSGIEVTARMGFEGIGTDVAGTLLNFTATIVNSTASIVSVRYGGISVDGQVVSPLLLVVPHKKPNKSDRQIKSNTTELLKMSCFVTGFLSDENYFSSDTTSRVLSVTPRNAMTVSTIVRDPRNYHSVRCSVDGCYPTGAMRYFIRVDEHDYVFVWPGQSAIYCGK